MRAPAASPEALVRRPADPGEVAQVLAAARDQGRVVVPRGGGGGAAPLAPEAPLVLSTGGLTGMVEYEPGDLTFTARAGTTLGELDRLLAPAGQWLPVDPPGGPDRTLGGLVATGLGGALHAGYGAVRDQVLGLSLVAGDGRLLRLGGRVMKNVAGFDLVRLVVGSRGALGVVVSVSMRVFPRPRGRELLVAEEVGEDALLRAGRGVATAPVVPASAVVVGGPGGSGSALVVAVHGAEASRAADRETLRAAAGVSFRVVPVEEGGEGQGEVGRRVARARDAGVGGAVAFRQGGLPSEVPDRWRALRAALPDAELHADLVSGVVRGSVAEACAGTVAAVRGVGAATGRAVLFTALAPGLHGEVEPWTGPGGQGGLQERLVARFDPHRVLAPPRFGR